ncbi:ATP-dependent DNA ligase [Opitutaceae bacterium EW11]|nr:ATP-dependent DNA ligase [Opitutaceae bacterium EW11]
MVVDGRTVQVSNLDKVLYPQSGFTKGDLIDYYIRISPQLIPHLRGRPLTLKRYPDGVDGFFFYEKRCPPHRPNWIHTASVYSHGRGQNMDYCLADDVPSLVWAANLADIELHTNLYLYRTQERPTVMVFDLDPGEGASVVHCAQVALWLRDALDRLGLQTVVKTSGSKGLQLYVPLNTAAKFDATKALARGLGEALEREHPELVVTKMAKELRKRKVLIDWSQNDQHKTTVCVYSLRATKDPSVSTPLRWSEVESLLATGDAAKVRFDPQAVLTRVEKLGDLFEPALTLKQKLPKGVPNLGRPSAEKEKTNTASPRQPARAQRAAASRTTSRGSLSSRKPRKTG